MLFKKADDYIFKILESGEIEKLDDIKIVIPGLSIAGNIYNENIKMNEFYVLGKNRNGTGVNVGNGRYIYTQRKERFIDTPEGDIMLDSDEELKKEFENTDYFTFYESDKENGEAKHYSFLVNGESYLLLDYFHIYQSEGKTKSVSISFDAEQFDENFLRRRGFTKPKKPREKYNALYISHKENIYYNIENDGEEDEDILSRIDLMSFVYGEALKASNEYYGIENDIKCCIDTFYKNNLNRTRDDGR